jgi:hypothetical protein
MAKIASQKLTEHGSYWSLPINGFRIIQLRFDYSFGMEIGDSQSKFSIRVNSAFTLNNTEGIGGYSAERLSELDPVYGRFLETCSRKGSSASQKTDGLLKGKWNTNHSRLLSWSR